jgi:hypothetical protein
MRGRHILRLHEVSLATISEATEKEALARRQRMIRLAASQGLEFFA